VRTLAEPSRPKLLIIDDSPFYRLRFSRIFGQSERLALIGTASNGEEGIRRIAEERPDVVLLDVHLGGEQTHELLARIRSARIPVALVTGSVDIADYRGQADAVLGKPFVPETLVGTARRLARVPSDA
jgi:CheY-like chemotaxis protein